MDESLEFSNGHSIRMLGLGTYTSPRDKVRQAVISALEVGYRHFDCVHLHVNKQKEIGQAIKDTLPRLGLKREDIFITTRCRVWTHILRPDIVRNFCEHSLKDLQLDYWDLYLVHWPVAFKPGGQLCPKLPDGKHIDTIKKPLMDTWREMEKLVDDGLAKSIGISNFSKRQIDLLLSNCRIKPVNLQVEIHANFPNTKLVEHAQGRGLTVTACAPLGSPGALPGKTNLLTQDWVIDIAKRHGKTPAQVLLRYLLQRNLIVIPKSVTKERIVENSKIFDFNLSEEEMKILGSKGLNKRQFPFPMMELSDDEY